MIVTSSIKRNIYPQTGNFSYVINVEADNITGYTSFGFSGNATKQQFSLRSGKLFYDTSDYYLDSYTSNQVTKISGNISSGLHTVYVNDTPKILGEAKSTGYYNYFYCSSKNTTSEVGVQILGDTPEYSYDVFKSYLSGQQIPISIGNGNAYPFKIFSGQVTNSNTSFTLSGTNNTTVSGNQSKNIYLIPQRFFGGAQQVPIRLYTNFGNVDFDFTASGQDLSTSTFYILFGPEQNNTVANGDTNNYTVYLKTNTGFNLGVGLEYVSGETGKYYKDITAFANKTGFVQGAIVGSGTLTGSATGIVSYNNPKTGIETGYGQGMLQKFVYATGTVIHNYELNMSGKGSGFLNILIPGTGYTNFDYTGYIGYNGGYISVSDLTGLGTGYLDQSHIIVDNIKSGIAKIYIPYTGDINISINSDDYVTEFRQSPLLFATGFVSKLYTLTGFAFATGEKVSGKFRGSFATNFEPGIYTFYKNWSGVATGVSNTDLDSFDPVKVTYNGELTYGIISGYYSLTQSTENCDLSIPAIIPVGVPQTIYRSSDGTTVNTADFYLVQPNDLTEYETENSSNPGSRTNISRRGNTPSGEGLFDNVFREPGYTGIWMESFNTGSTQGTGDSKRVTNKVTANPLLLYGDILTGKFKVDGNYSGYQTYKWKGTVKGNFEDYSTYIYKANAQYVPRENVLYKFPSSYSFEMNLRTGYYVFTVQKNNQTPGGIPLVYYPTEINGYSNSQLQIPIQLTDNAPDDVILTYQITDLTAKNGTDYTTTFAPVQFPNGKRGVSYLDLNIANTISPNTSKQFQINFTNVYGDISNELEVKYTPILVDLTNPSKGTYSADCCNTGSNIVSSPMCSDIIGANNTFDGYNGVTVEDVVFNNPIPNNAYVNMFVKFMGLGDQISINAINGDNQPINILSGKCGQNFINRVITVPAQTKALQYRVIGGCNGSVAGRKPWKLIFECPNTGNYTGFSGDPSGTGLPTGGGEVNGSGIPSGILCGDCFKKVNMSGGYEIKCTTITFPRPITEWDDLAMAGVFDPYTVPDQMTIYGLPVEGNEPTILFDTSCVGGANYYGSGEQSSKIYWGISPLPIGLYGVKICVDGTCSENENTLWFVNDVTCAEGCCSYTRLENGCSCNFRVCCCPEDYVPDRSACPSSYAGCVFMPCTGTFNKTGVGNGRYAVI